MHHWYTRKQVQFQWNNLPHKLCPAIPWHEHDDCQTVRVNAVISPLFFFWLNLTGMIDVACFCSFSLIIHAYWERTSSFTGIAAQCSEMILRIVFVTLSIALVDYRNFICISLFLKDGYLFHPVSFEHILSSNGTTISCQIFISGLYK